MKIILWLKARRKGGQQLVDADCPEAAKLAGDAGDTGADHCAGHHSVGVLDQRCAQRRCDCGVKRVLDVRILVSHLRLLLSR